MDPLINDCLSDAAAHLGDTAMEQFTAGILMPYFGQAFREVYDIMVRWKLPMGLRTVYVHLPALTNQITTAQCGINDMGEPNEVWERPITVSSAITGVSNTTPVVVGVVSGAGFNNGVKAEVAGIVGPVGVNGQWFITTSGNNITLTNSVAGGVYVSGGQMIYSAAYFSEMTPSDDLPQGPPIDRNMYWKWENERFWFVGATQDTELQIRYSTNGNAPTTGTVGIENSRNHLGNRIASLVAGDYDMPATMQRLTRLALGPTLEPDGTGGSLRGLVLPMLLEKQKRRVVSGTFRPRRNTLTRNFW